MMIEETGRCIKCYTCVEVCPALFNTTKPYMTAFPGKVPPEFGFHLLRYAHVAESCIDCGQCEELCPMDIPNALFMHAIEADLEALLWLSCRRGHVTTKICNYEGTRNVELKATVDFGFYGT